MSLLDVMHEETGKADDEQGRAYGFCYGVVTNIDDPDETGRIKARFGAQRDNEESDWLMPGFPGSMECEPNKDDEVLIAFVDGDPSRGIWLATVTKNTKKRAKEAAMLGNTFAAMYNQLKSDVQTLVTAYNNLSVDTMSGMILPGSKVFLLNTPPGSIGAGDIQDADGQSVAASSGDKKALSGKVVLR